jgi:ABC-type molybdate transport system substrate-binding protein
MRAVVLTSRGNPKAVARWADLTSDDVTVSLANPSAAIGKLVRVRLLADGRWQNLAPRVVGSGTVVDSANAAKVGSADAAIVWDVVAARYAGGPEPRQAVLVLPELADVTARVVATTLTQSRDASEAQRFARFLASPRGLAYFRAAGFAVEAPK